jgi:hypothetical protein
MQFVKPALICLALELTGCAFGIRHQDIGSSVTAVQPAMQPQTVGNIAAAPIEVEKVEFKLGPSSVTVERLAKQQGCDSELGAGLLTVNGPVEIYRVNCPDRSVFMATCEFRQCTPMRRNQ